MRDDPRACGRSNFLHDLRAACLDVRADRTGRLSDAVDRAALQAGQRNIGSGRIRNGTYDRSVKCLTEGGGGCEQPHKTWC